MTKTPTFFLIGLSSYWFTLTFIFGAVISILIPTLMDTWFGPTASGKWLGIAMGIGGISATASQLVTGAISDHSTSRWGRRRPFILAGSSLSVVVFLLMAGGLRGYWHFVALFLFAQIVLNVAAAPYTALLPDLVPKEEHGRAAGLMGTARILGEGLGIVFSARIMGKDPIHGTAIALAGHLNERLMSLMLLFAVLLTVTTIVILVICREEPLKDNDGTTWQGAVGSIFRTSLRDYPDFTWLLVSRATINLGVYTVASFIKLFFKYTLKVPDPNAATGMMMGIILVSGAIGSYPAGVLSDRLGRKVILFIACGITAATGFLFVFCPSVPFAMVCAAIMGVGFGAFLSTDWAFACNLLPSKDPARYLAIWNLGAALPQVFATPIGGLIADWIHNSGYFPLGHGYRAIFLLAVVYFVLGALMITRVREPVEQRVAHLQNGTHRG